MFHDLSIRRHTVGYGERGSGCRRGCDGTRGPAEGWRPAKIDLCLTHNEFDAPNQDSHESTCASPSGNETPHIDWLVPVAPANAEDEQADKGSGDETVQKELERRFHGSPLPVKSLPRHRITFGVQPLDIRQHLVRAHL
jgi:hypothetical protein